MVVQVECGPAVIERTVGVRAIECREFDIATCHGLDPSRDPIELDFC